MSPTQQDSSVEMDKGELAQLLLPGRGETVRKNKIRSMRASEDADEEAEEAEEDGELANKFVNLIDILPDLPKKGEFDVNKIKSSAYFFS